MTVKKIEEKWPLVIVICMSLILIACVVSWQIFESYRSYQDINIKTTNAIRDDLFNV